MTALPLDKLEELHDMQLTLQECLRDLRTNNHMMAQLTTDKCSCIIQFTLHNKTVCDQNEALKQVSLHPKRDCKSSLFRSVGESPGIRVLHAIKQERQIVAEELQKKLSDMLAPYYSPNTVSNEHL